MNTLSICSLNTHGIKGNLAYIDLLCKDFDILFTCEHWLRNDEKYIVDSISEDKNVFFSSSMDECYSSGRPFGGLCWFIHKNLKVLKYEFLSNFLTTVTLLLDNNRKMTLIGTYCIYNNNTADHNRIYENQLSVISSLVDQCKDDNTDFILLGDFNADPFRNRYSFDKLFNSFLTENSLVTSIGAKNHHFTYSNEVCNSCIDHILVDKNSNLHLYDSHIEYNLCNTSDHNAITANFHYLKNNRSFEFSCNESLKSNRRKKLVINWSSAHATDLYNYFLESKLRLIQFLNFSDENNLHDNNNKIDNLYNQICNACTEANEEVCFILHGNKNSNIHKQSWWTKELLELKKNVKMSRYQYRNDPSDYNRHQRNVHKKQFRRIQRRNLLLYEQNKAKNIEHLFNINNKDDFWKAFNSFKNCSDCSNLSNSDADELVVHLKNLFHVTDTDVIDNESQREILNRVMMYKEECKNNFFTNDRLYASSKLIEDCIDESKSSNCAGLDGVNSNMIKNGKSTLLISLIKCLINAILSSGHIPDGFNRTMINPIVKDKNLKVFDKNNFRPISISNFLAQIFERVILKLAPNLQMSADVQFGFKMGISTYQPLFLVKETISKYKRSKSPCYVVSLDAEKAFDSLWRKGLFYKLIDKLEKNLWFILEEYYAQSEGFIFISESKQSELFVINRGVKQGGVLSPTLFNIYVNDLLIKVNISDYGCYIDSFKTTILGYCDDLILMASSVRHMQLLLNMCEEYSLMWKMKFNPKKSIVINCGLKIYDDDDIDLFISNNKIPVVDESKYLGLIINKSNDGNESSLLKFKTVEKCFFGLSGFGIKPPGLNPFVKAFLYNNYCLPKCTYGMGIFQLKKATLKRINTSQNYLFRYALGIPYKSHISKVMKTLKIVDAETLYYAQICTLVKLLHRHDYTKSLLVKCLEINNTFQLDIYDDLRFISEKYGIQLERVIYYPDKTREQIINYYLNTDQDKDKIEELEFLLRNFSIENKNKLINLTKLEFVNNINLDNVP